LTAADEPGRALLPADVAVVHVCEALGGGVLEVVLELANRTAERGVPTTLVHGRRPETPVSLGALVHPGVRIVEVPRWGVRRPRTALAATFRAARAVRAEARRSPRGVVHVHSSFAGPVRLTLLPRGWRLVYSPHAYAFLNDSLPRAARIAARALEWVLGRRGRTLAVSRAEGEVASSLVGARRVVVVRNGVELPPETEAPEGSPFVVTVAGRALHQRRPDLVAAVAESFRDADIAVRWLGDGPARAELERAGVAVSGWLPRARVVEELARSHAVLHLSAFEGLPLALLEAMASGRPVVASDLPPIREVTGDAALLVRDADEAIAALRLLASDHELSADLGSRGRARVARLFTAASMVERTLAAYDLPPSPQSFPQRRVGSAEPA
jgi:glycosyltransferase involved in cell wall biosynthesis